MISALLMAAEFGIRVIRMITLMSFVLLVCWAYASSHDIQATLQMEQFGTSIPPVLNLARSACIS